MKALETTSKAEPKALTALDGPSFDLYMAYRETPLLSEAAKKIGIELHEAERLVAVDDNLERWLAVAEREFRDRVEKIVMARAGLFGEEACNSVKYAKTKELLALIRSRDSRFGDNNQKPQAQNNTQINAGQVVIQYKEGNNG